MWLQKWNIKEQKKWDENREREDCNNKLKEMENNQKVKEKERKDAGNDGGRINQVIKRRWI